MGLYISLRKKGKDIDFNRFRSGFHLFSEIFKAFVMKNSSIVFYQDYPLKELNKDFERVDFKFGLLESSFRQKLKDMGFESGRAGFEIRSELFVSKKKFNLLFELIPRNKSNFFDIRIGLLPNGYSEDIEDVEVFYPKLREYIFDRIFKYNKELEKHKDKKVFSIRRALISDHNKEFYDIDSWLFFYSKEPEDFINHIYHGDSEMGKRLSLANRDRFSEVLKNSNNFIYKLYNYAEESKVIIKEGSICLIPQNQDSMKSFVNRIRGKIKQSVKKIYPTPEEIEKDINKIFS